MYSTYTNFVPTKRFIFLVTPNRLFDGDLFVFFVFFSVLKIEMVYNIYSAGTRIITQYMRNITQRGCFPFLEKYVCLVSIYWVSFGFRTIFVLFDRNNNILLSVF